MDIKITYTLTLTEEEALALKTVLGHLSDIQYNELGVTGLGLEAMHDLWNMLPDDEEE